MHTIRQTPTTGGTLSSAPLTKIAVAGAACLALLAAPCAHARVDWKPVDAEALSLKAPLVDKDAPAEILFKEIRIEFKADVVEISEYARIKVFSDRGREQGTVSVPHFDKDKIREVSGRTTKPSGATQELAADSIFDRTVVKANGHKVKLASFALPKVEAGDVIEYRWRARSALRMYERIEIQAEIPTERVRVVFKNTVVGLGVHWVGLYQAPRACQARVSRDLAGIREPAWPTGRAADAPGGHDSRLDAVHLPRRIPTELRRSLI